MLLVLFRLFIAYGTLIPFVFSATSEQVESRRHQFLKLPLVEAARTE